MRRIISLFLVLVILSVSTWCGCAKPERGGLEIIDQVGRRINIPDKVERIVSLWPEASRILYALGVGDRIVGVDDSTKTCPILTRAFPGVKGIVDVGNPVKGTLSIEKLAEVKPDIIFMYTDVPELADRVQTSLGIPVVCVRINPPPQRKVSYDIVTIIGKCVGREERAKKVKDYLEHKLSEVVSVTSKILEERKPRIYQAWAFDLLRTLGYCDVIELAGGRSVAMGAEKAWYNVSLEQVLLWNPDIIILHGFGRFAPSDVMNNPKWQPIKAVKGGKVYKLTLGWFGWDPGSFVVNVMQNAKIFYPEKFQLLNVEKEANKIFKELYGVDGLYTKLKSDYKLSNVDRE